MAGSITKDNSKINWEKNVYIRINIKENKLEKENVQG